MCQLRCAACPTASGANARLLGRGYLAFANFQKLVDDNPEIGLIELSNYGEPFLNPEMLAILEYAHRKGVQLSFGNGANLNTVSPAVLEGVVKYGLRRLTCSIDGVTQETYAKYRIRGNLATALENVRTIDAHKKRYGAHYPVLTWQFIVFSHNRHELEAARRMAGELGMHFVPKLSWNEDGDTAAPSPQETAPHSRSAYRARYGVDYMRTICHQLWTMPQINWDGAVLGCCRNYWGDFGGNALSGDLLSALNSERIVYAREMLRGKRPPRADIPCSTCALYRSMAQNGLWLTRSETFMPGHIVKRLFESGVRAPAAFAALAIPFRLLEIATRFGNRFRRRLRATGWRLV